MANQSEGLKERMHLSGEGLIIILVVGVIAGWLAGKVVAQRKRRPHKGGARFNNNRPSSVRPVLPTRIRVSPRRSAHRRREGGSSLGRKPCVRWRLKPHKAYEGGDDEDEEDA